MKVLVVHNAYQTRHIGGEDVVVAREIAALKSSLGEDNLFSYEVNNDSIEPLKLARTIWGDKSHAEKIAALIKTHQIDIVHVHNFFPLLTPAVFVSAKEAGAKVVHTLHNFRWWCLSGDLYQNNRVCEQCIGKKWGWPAVIKKCYRDSYSQSLVGSLAYSWYQYKGYQDHIDAYFALSNFQMEKLKPLIPAHKLLLKPNMIEEPKNYFELEMKKHYLFVGRLDSAKGIEVLLKVWQELPDQFQLDIIGEGNDDLVEKYQSPRVNFLGKRNHKEVLERMSRAKFLLHTSLAYETFGLAIVEALARGTPVIGFNLGTRPEFIEAGFNGFLCQPENLSDAIIKSYYHPDYESLSINARESAKTFFETPLLFKQLDLYHQILRN